MTITNEHSITLRAAKPTLDEGMVFARYLDEAAEGFFRFMLGRRSEHIISKAFIQPDHDLSYQNVTFAERNKVIMGMVSGYTSEQHKKSSSLDPLIQAAGKYNIRMWVVLILFAPLLRVIDTIADDDFVTRLPEKTKPVGAVLNPVVDEWHFATNHPAFKDYLSIYGGSLDASLNPEREYARAFYTRHNWPYLDLYDLMSDDPGKYVLREDGVHMNKTGHELFARKMFELISSLL